MSINTSAFQLDQLDISNLNKIRIDFSLGKTQGRRFTVSLDGNKSEEVLFKDIFKKVFIISKKEKNIPHLNTIQTFLEDLKVIEQIAAKASELKETQDLWYKINTWIHRLFQCGSHSQNINNLIEQLATRLNTLDVDLEVNRIKNLFPIEIAHETEMLVSRLVDGNNLNEALQVIETFSSFIEHDRLYLKVADMAFVLRDLATANIALNRVNLSNDDIKLEVFLKKLIITSNSTGL